MSRSEKPLWKCPKCGHEFVSENLWHSCGRYSLVDLFEDSDPDVRGLFDRFAAMVEACGPVTIYPHEARIVCQVRVRFANVVPRRRDLDVSVWLSRPVKHAKLRRTELIPPDTFVHHFRFKRPTELDDGFMAIVREGYAVGRQEQLERGASHKPRRRQRRSGKRKRAEQAAIQPEAARPDQPPDTAAQPAAEPPTAQPPPAQQVQAPGEPAQPADKQPTAKPPTAKRRPARKRATPKADASAKGEKPARKRAPTKKRASSKGKRAPRKPAAKPKPTPPEETGDAS